MKKVAAVLFFIFHFSLFAAIPELVKANHCAGGELNYEWVSDSTYRFYFKFYRDCSGAAVNATQDLCVINPCIPSSSFTVPLSRISGTVPAGYANGTPVATGCPGNPTRCENISSAVPNYEEWWYTGLATLPSRCNAWRFVVWFNARNSSMNIASGNLFIEATLNNALFQGNSSSAFSVKPMAYACVNQSNAYNNGSIDDDGDSLVTEIINPLSATACNTTPVNLLLVPTSPAYSIPANPIQTNNQFLLNQQTGQFHFVPTATGAGTLTTRVKEYRKGILVGYTMRDVQLQVISSCNNPAPYIAVDPASISGGGYPNNVVSGCVGQSLNFCFNIQSNAGAILSVSDNHGFALPALAITYTNKNTDSVRGCVSWTPQLKDTGIKEIVIIIKDSNCLSGVASYHSIGIPLYTWPPTQAYKDTLVCPGDPVQLQANGGGNFSWTVVFGGSGTSSLSCTSCSSPIATPTLTTQYIVTSYQNLYCSNNKDTVTIGIKPLPKFTKLKDTITCPHNPLNFDLKPTPPVGVNYKYKWMPSTYLNYDTISNPVSKPANDIKYIVTITNDQNTCTAYDTVDIDVLDGFTLFTKDTAICLEELIVIHASGDIRYKYLWTTNCPVVDIITTTGLTPTIQPKVLGNFSYTLTASYPGCTDSVKTIKIDAQPPPYTSIDKDFRTCYGNKVQLHASILPDTYPYMVSWSPATNLNNPTILKPIFSAQQLGINTLTFTVKSSGGCKSVNILHIDVYPAEILTLSTHDTAICGGDSIQLHLSGNGLKSFAWYPNMHIDSPRSYNPIVKPIADQTYIASGIDSNQCTDTQEVHIIVKPAALTYLPDSVNVYPGAPYRIEPGGNCLYFNWWPGAGLDDSTIANPLALPDTTTTYYVAAHTEFGCSTLDTIKVQVMPNMQIFAPNAFSPNELTNNIFKPIYFGKAKLKQFAIYDRWGVQVFSTSNINEGWDGTYKGVLQPLGVYIYAIDAQTLSGKHLFKNGNVTLIR